MMKQMSLKSQNKKNVHKMFLATFSAVVVAGISVLVGACSPAAPKLAPKPYEVVEQVAAKGDSVDTGGKVDILFVVDRSGSMSTHQQNLADNIDLFLAELSKINIDYQAGVISSDGDFYSEYGKLWGNRERIVKSSMKNAADLIRKNILVGINGDASEVFFDPIMKALSPAMLASPGGYNAGFIRPDAYLAVIFITDAEDQSAPNAVNQIGPFLDNLKSSHERVLSYGIIIPSRLGNNPNCSRDDMWDTPRRLESFLDSTINAQTVNNVMELCDPDFGTKLAGFSKDLVRYLRGVILLKQLPIESTIKVTYNGMPIKQGFKDGWTYSRTKNAIILGDEIALDPNFVGDGTGLQVDFTAVPDPLD